MSRIRAFSASEKWKRPPIIPHHSLLFSPELEDLSTENQRNLLVANTRFASTFTAQHDLLQAPTKSLILITCIDVRIDPIAAFGVQPGEAHIIRNAGGSAKDAFRSILTSQHFLGTGEIIVMKHERCGMATFTNEEAHAMVHDKDGKRLLDPCFDFHCFSDVEEAVRYDVRWLQDNKAIIRETDISGWVYDVQSGRVRKIV